MKRRLVFGLLVACASCEIDPGRAPVSERMEPVPRKPLAVAKPVAPLTEPKTPQPEVRAYRNGDWRPAVYVVKKGDTLYSIALDHGEDYRELAQWNGIADPALIKIGQALRLTAPASVTAPGSDTSAAVAPSEPIPVKSEPKPQRLPYSDAVASEYFPSMKAASQKPSSLPKPVPAREAKVEARVEPKRDAPSGEDTIAWAWPAPGKLIYAFGAGAEGKGVGIDGKAGQSIAAAAAGKVVYSGSGLRGYGNLVIIKHNASYLSVYAHNQKLLVREGQMVKQGQAIAEMGSSDADRVALHFEVRRFGKPVDPMKFLPALGKS